MASTLGGDERNEIVFFDLETAFRPNRGSLLRFWSLGLS
uniref:Truncated APOLLO n=1 Tax=Boechera sp. IPK 43 TaxID=1415651 RepID=U5U573_9BRAS|nr:truncated APOLLO [Boechera sp. IPK 43]